MSTEESPNVPSHAITWTAWLRSAPDRRVTVTARLWYEARREALPLLDAGGYAAEMDVDCEASDD
jgi:hypothetical protein